MKYLVTIILSVAFLILGFTLGQQFEKAKLLDQKYLPLEDVQTIVNARNQEIMEIREACFEQIQELKNE